MSQQYPQQPFQPQQPAPKVKEPMSRAARIGWGILIGAVVFIAGFAVGATANPQASPASALGAPAPTTTVTVTAPAAPEIAEETTEPPAPTYGTPAKTDFKLTVKVLTKKCFGSAGCNLTFRILVSYTGPSLDPAATYEVLYQVKGGEDGPVDNKLTVTGTESSVDEEEYIQVKTSKSKVTAVVTEVLGQ